MAAHHRLSGTPQATTDGQRNDRAERHRVSRLALPHRKPKGQRIRVPNLPWATHAGPRQTRQMRRAPRRPIRSRHLHLTGRPRTWPATARGRPARRDKAQKQENRKQKDHGPATHGTQRASGAGALPDEHLPSRRPERTTGPTAAVPLAAAGNRPATEKDP